MWLPVSAVESKKIWEKRCHMIPIRSEIKTLIKLNYMYCVDGSATYTKLLQHFIFSIRIN